VVPVPLVLEEGKRFNCAEEGCDTVMKLVYRDGQYMATEADKDTTPKVLIPGVIKLIPERLQFFQSDKPCFKDYDPNELGCEECDDKALCKARSPRVRLKRR